jgi:general stress protein 26
MIILSEEIKHFFLDQGFVIISTIDHDGGIHNSCKGIADIDPDGWIYLIDVYRARTFKNLQDNTKISITAVDEHKFKGYCLKGQAKIVVVTDLSQEVIDKWETRLAGRITKRVLANISQDKSQKSHPEALLPKPEYLIAVKVAEIIDLAPVSLARKYR